jgi:hypothetical protein
MMRVKIYTQHGALNSKPIFDALKLGLQRTGHTIVDSGEDLAVIWSVLWLGRMSGNQKVYNWCKKNNIPVMIVEVGNLLRGRTWRLCLNNINGLGKFANSDDIDPLRPRKLGVFLKPEAQQRKDSILIACQHQRSLQWEGLPPTQKWVEETIRQIRNYTDKKIIVRPHPRNLFNLRLSNIYVQIPSKVKNSYDDYDIDYDHHCVVNYNSGPAVQAAIAGVPVVCDASSLAFPVSDELQNIDSPALKDRSEWFLRLCHTEWTVEEITKGEPIDKLFKHLG